MDESNVHFNLLFRGQNIQQDLWISADNVKFDDGGDDALTNAWIELHERWNCCGSYGPEDWSHNKTVIGHICGTRTDGCGEHVKEFLNQFSSSFFAQFFLQTLFWLTSTAITISLGKSIQHFNYKSTPFTR